MNYIFRKAEKNDADQIWVILQEAIELRKNEAVLSGKMVIPI